MGAQRERWLIGSDYIDKNCFPKRGFKHSPTRLVAGLHCKLNIRLC